MAGLERNSREESAGHFVMREGANGCETLIKKS